MLAAGTAFPVGLGFSKQDFGVWMKIPAFPAGFVPPVVVSPQGQWEQPPDQGSMAMSSYPEFLLFLSAVPGLGAREVPGTEMEPGFISRTWMWSWLGML